MSGEDSGPRSVFRRQSLGERSSPSEHRPHQHTDPAEGGGVADDDERRLQAPNFPVECGQRLVVDGEAMIVVDPGMVADRSLILGPLRERGVQVAMLTGDNAAAARSVAAQVGIAPERTRGSSDSWQ